MAENPTGTRRLVFKENTRRVILDAAYALFAEKGYAATTMRMLASRAGVGLGTIFKHFPDKPSLLASAFQEDLGAVVEQAFATLPASDFKAQLLHLTERLYGFYARDPGLSRTLVSEALFMADSHGKILDDQLQAFLHGVSLLLAQAAERGELSRSITPMEGALAYGSFYFGVLVQGLRGPVFDVPAQLRLVATLLDNHFSG